MLTIDTSEQTCTCSIFHNKLVCKHLVAACLTDKVWLPGFKVMPKLLRTVRRRKVQNLSIEIRQQELDEQIVVSQVMATGDKSEEQRKKRGRPKKS